jgi:hypothetical protein
MCSKTEKRREVVFTLLAERYERGSILLTSNLPFSKWEGIFKDAMTTAAAIDRLVHHCVILELNILVIAWNKPKRTGTQARSLGELTDCHVFSTTKTEKYGGRRAVEKDGRWKARKTKSRFSSLPTALGNPAKPAGLPLFPQPRLLLASLKQDREI